MAIYNVPGKIYLNIGELPGESLNFKTDLYSEEMTWSLEPLGDDDLMYVQQQIYNEQHNEAKMFHNAYKAARSMATEYRAILKEAIKHNDPAVYIASELLRLEAEE